MYTFMTYCIAYGVFISKPGIDPMEQAKAAYRHFKNTTLSKELIAVSNDVHKKNALRIQKSRLCVNRS